MTTWRMGKWGGAIVSDTNDLGEDSLCNDSGSEKSYGGKYFICESVGGSRMKNLLLAVPELLRACENLSDFCYPKDKFGNRYWRGDVNMKGIIDPAAQIIRALKKVNGEI